MSDSTTLTIRLDEELKARLDRLAAATRRSRSFLAEEAVRAYVALNEWQIQELDSAITEADAEDFAAPEELRSVLEKWRMNGTDGDGRR